MSSHPVSSHPLWGGRFSSAPDEVAARFSASVESDSRLAAEDIDGSLAHARMLAKQGVISGEDLAAIECGFTELRSEIEADAFKWDPAHEDVHLNLERALTARIGDAGKRLHTARSRNDQVATDMRLWSRKAVTRLTSELLALVEVVLDRVRQDGEHLLPAYTHLQRAQPVRLGHHLLAWVAMWLRDADRLLDARERLNFSPLGAGALATTTFPIDRAHTAAALGFRAPMWNSLDAVSSRDFLLELLGSLSILQVHLSRVAEELVLWSSQEFAFVEMSDAFATGSSMMPQKKNPDMAELIRGKSSVAPAAFLQVAMMLKALPLTYNRDMQEDKDPVFRAFDTSLDSLIVMRGMLASLRFKPSRMSAALRDGFIEATDVADYLAGKGVPFREAHACSGKLVAAAVQAGCTLLDLPLAMYQSVNAAFEADVFESLAAEAMVERRDVLGGPASARVQEALGLAGAELAVLKQRL